MYVATSQAGIAADSTSLATSGFATRMADQVMQELLWDPQGAVWFPGAAMGAQII